MSTTSPTPYVPYQAYKSKRHSRVLSNPTPPAEVPNVNTSVNVNASINGTGEAHGQTRHASWSSADFALRVNGENAVGGASGVSGKVARPWALKSDVAPSTANLDSNANENGGDTSEPGAGARTGTGTSTVPIGNANSKSVVRTRPASVMIIPHHQIVSEGNRVSSSEPTSPGVSSTSPGIGSVISTKLNGGLSISEANTELLKSGPTGGQSTPTYSSSSSNGSNELPCPSSEPNGKASTSPTVSEKSAGKAPATAASEANAAGPSTTPSSPPSPSSARSSSSISNPRRTSTFRYVPLRPPNTSSKSTAPRTSSPLRPANTIQPHAHNRAASTSGLSPLASARHLGDQPSPASIHSELAPETTTHSGGTPRPGISNVNGNSNTHHRSSSMLVSPFASRASSASAVAPRINPPQRTSSLSHPPPITPPNQSISPSFSSFPAPAPAPMSISTTGLSRVQSPSPIPQGTPSTATTASAPTSMPSTPTSTAISTATYKAVYRPGFQPKGVYRPLTDDFLALRKRARDEGRIELTRLERRFEKLVDLHFSPTKADEEQDSNAKGKEKANSGTNVVMAPGLARRASSFFEELGELRGKSASELWKSVLESRAAAANGAKGDIRSAEQRITPWEEDADVSACPHCSASFHPLTNRKHHCRLCGRIICSLPVKKPQRPVPCSLLFVSDPKTGRIEEVTEGVDYGVRPRTSSNAGRSGVVNGSTSEEKFLKGVRICRECKSVMLRQQYRQEAKRVPTMVRLYEVLVSLESEIEELLPHFQELMLSLSNNPDEAPTKEASAARKHLLECFADYDAIAKRIRKIPCPGGPGSSQDRVLGAIQVRANMFLQKNMFPLQSLPKPKRRASAKANGDSTPPDSTSSSQVIDPDSELAQALQPLLEQEALLESFVEEATTHRKFEDAKTLKANLAEIRAEIDRIVIQAEGGTR